MSAFPNPRRLLTVFVLVAAVLVVVGVAQGDGLSASLGYGALWGAISTAVYAVAQAVQARRAARCAVCHDEPAAADA